MAGLPNTPVGVESTLPPRLVLYDGVCGICDRSVQWLIDHDPADRLHFAPLQGSTAAALRRDHPGIPDDIDTIVYLEEVGGSMEIFLRSQAILRICEAIGIDSRAVRWLRRLPCWLVDLGYRLFVPLRYRVFGTLDSCRVPSVSQRRRFLP